MNRKQFVRQHREEWKQIEQLISLVHKKKNKLTAMEINNFHHLYQKVSQHLSYSQTFFPNEELTSYLNDLVSKSHNLLYKEQVSSWNQIKTFFSTTFIELFIEQWKAIVVAMLLFAFGALASFFSVLEDPLHIHTILPSDLAQGVNPEQIGSNNDNLNAPLMSASIMTNNIQVAILAFAGGITFGLLTVYLLLFNGIIIGGLAALFWHHGKTYEFWAFIVPHGMIELTAIFIAGGAGLLMGYKLFVPGNYSRIYQLKTQSKRSIQLLIGTVPLFIIAGIVEGFITPADISLEAKYSVACITVFSLIVYVCIGKIMLRKHSKSGHDS